MRLIEWDTLEFRISGEKVAAQAREMIARDPTIERIDLQFSNGLLRVQGAVRKIIVIPFTVDITQFIAGGTTVRVPLARITAGPIPIPTLLIGLLRRKFPADVGFE